VQGAAVGCLRVAEHHELRAILGGRRGHGIGLYPVSAAAAVASRVWDVEVNGAAWIRRCGIAKGRIGETLLCGRRLKKVDVCENGGGQRPA
jgi:hypothetical protein